MAYNSEIARATKLRINDDLQSTTQLHCLHVKNDCHAEIRRLKYLFQYDACLLAAATCKPTTNSMILLSGDT